MHGKYYEAGCIPCVLYTASGTSLDWALGVAGIPYVYRCQYVNVYRYEKERTYIQLGQLRLNPPDLAQSAVSG